MSIDILGIFKEIKGVYVIIKLSPEFPYLKEYSDIDIICFDPDRFIRSLSQNFNNYVMKGYQIKIYELEKNYQVDYCLGEKLILKLDIYKRLPAYSKLSLKPEFLYSLLENRVCKEYNQVSIFIPSEIDECILRYLEYYELFEKQNDKIKHLYYLENSLERNNLYEDFLNKIYLYTEPKKLDVPLDTHFGATSVIRKKMKIRETRLFRRVRRFLGKIKRYVFR